ncbi:MAG: restriction endonuclease subunit S [Bacteroidales bacterium]|nr:restriction endonuclease subunit S [Bacteroidales bacterium]
MTTYHRLGDYIREVNIRNRDLKVTNLLGMSISKKFIPSIANTIGTDMATYKIIKRNQFAYVPVTSRNGEKITIALLNDDDEAIISQAYTVFEITDKEQLLPEYLMMWFRRPEFDRYARFHSHGSAREVFDWDELCDVKLPVPPIARQREIVAEYATLTNRIRLNEQMIAKLEETAQALYRKMFVDGVDKERLPEGWRMGKLGEVAEYVDDKMSLADIEESSYIATENMLKDKKGIVVSTNKPEEGRGTRFLIDDVLVSNIRPYFKKIWRATFDGISSNDVLCFRAMNEYNASMLYYTLEQDCFFDYVMAGSNGVKMPRGDKEWIMNYPIIIPSKKDIDEYERSTTYIHLQTVCRRQENEKLTELQSLLLARMGE